MRFVCDHIQIKILVDSAEVLEIEKPNLKTYTELEDDRLITIARTLGMEELAPVDGDNPPEGEPAIEVYVVGEKKPVFWPTSDMPACEICGKPVKTKRSRVCSEECRQERQRRYAREYQQRKAREDAGGGLPPLSETEWGSDPGDEPVRSSGRL